MEISYRPYNADEVKLLKSYKFSAWKHFENFGMKLVGFTFLFVAPLLLYEGFVAEVPPDVELPIVIVLAMAAVGLTIYFMNRMGELTHNRQIEQDIRTGEAEVIKVRTDYVLKRKEYEDLGSGFYLKIDDRRTLYLQGQYLDELQYSKKFPNTDFEIIRSKKNKELLDIKPNGEYLKPARKLKPFTKEQFESGNIHEDGEILHLPIEEIK
ncbi:hypothetical protein [Cesiribacter sp. SM1]|uniref:hypothetical protein n=1 Tax=Cesiribacter sp. SM1 TaxID=2861196 RepID=UPI001CD4B072|nr:hypothetical protein [Cesiribacter sp. SM1]